MLRSVSAFSYINLRTTVSCFHLKCNGVKDLQCRADLHIVLDYCSCGDPNAGSHHCSGNKSLIAS